MSLAALVIADARDDAGRWFGTFIVIYTVLIFIRILMSWIPRMPYNRWLDGFLRFVMEVTDPFLNFFRRFIPPVRLGGAGLDLSPMVAILVLYLVGGVITRLIAG